MCIILIIILLLSKGVMLYPWDLLCQVLGSEKKTSRKRPLSLSDDDINGIDVPCPQCGNAMHI